jgi:RNA polymerase sigma-70 factor (ECF subfamily)
VSDPEQTQNVQQPARLADADSVERELLARAQCGDPQAYGQLVAPYQQLAFRSAWLITRDSTSAEDAVQEGLLKAWRALPRFRTGVPLRPWLLRIVVNEARNHRRHSGRQQRLALRNAETLVQDSRQNNADAPEDWLVARERQAELLAALEQLREEERLVVSYRYLLGLSEQETATALDIPRGTVKSRLARGLRHLRQHLAETHLTEQEQRHGSA